MGVELVMKTPNEMPIKIGGVSFILQKIVAGCLLILVIGFVLARLTKRVGIARNMFIK